MKDSKSKALDKTKKVGMKLLSDKEAVKKFHEHKAYVKTLPITHPDHPDYGK